MQTKRNIIVIMILLVIAGVLVFSSSFFMISSITYTTAKVAEVKYEELFNDENIEDTTSIKKGSSIFVINFEKVKDSVEFKAPKLKVLNVTMVSQNKVFIELDIRSPKYYYVSGEEYFLLDNELKVIEKTNVEPIYKKITFDDSTPSVLVGKNLNEEPLREYVKLFSLMNMEGQLQDITVTNEKIIFSMSRSVTFTVENNLEKITNVVSGKDEGKFATMLGLYNTGIINSNIEIIVDASGTVKAQ